jgi:hypothetical protein
MMRGASSAPPKPKKKTRPVKQQAPKPLTRKDAAVLASGPRRFSVSRWLELHQEVAVDSLSRLLGQFLSSLMTWALTLSVRSRVPVAVRPPHARSCHRTQVEIKHGGFCVHNVAQRLTHAEVAQKWISISSRPATAPTAPPA